MNMYIFVYIYMHTFIYICTYIYICLCTYISIYMNIYIHIVSHSNTYKYNIIINKHILAFIYI